MHKKLEKLTKEDMICIAEEMIEDLKEHGMTPYVNKYMEIIEDKVYCITPEEAKEIVYRMKPHSECFTMEVVKQMLQNNGLEYTKKNCVRYYLCMNMYANDARQVADENHLDLDKFCFVMAKSFINDTDGGKHKVEKYFTEIIPM